MDFKDLFSLYTSLNHWSRLDFTVKLNFLLPLAQMGNVANGHWTVCPAEDGRLNIDFHRLLIKASFVVVAVAVAIVLHGELVSCVVRQSVRHRGQSKHALQCAYQQD